MPVIYRLAAPGQAALVLGLIQLAFEEYRGRLEPPSAALEETLETVKATMHAGGAALAEAGGQAVAAALFRSRDDCLYVGRVSVIPAHRGRGIARGLMLFLEDQARRLGRAAIEIGVRESLPSNVALYRGLGYRITASEPHPRGPAFNSLTMRKEV